MEPGGTRAMDRVRDVGALFEREIRPKLPALEARRAELAALFRRDVAWLAGFAASAALLAVLADRPLALVLVVMVAMLAAAVLYVRRRRAWTGAALEAVVSPVVAGLGATRHEPDGALDRLMAFEALGLVGAARHRILAHRIEGTRAGQAFEAQHATLARTRGRRGGTGRLFHGLLLKVAVPSPPPERLVIVPAQDATTQIFAGVARPLVPPSFQRIELGDPDFDGRFHVLAPAAEPALVERVRAFLSRGFREALGAIDAEEARGPGRARVRAAFDGDAFYLALPRVERPGWGPFRSERLVPFLDPGGLFAREPLEERMRAMAEDLALPHRIVDRLVGA